MADDLNYAVTVNSEGKLSYPENFISTNNIAQFGNDVSGILKDLTLDGVSKIRIYDKKQKMWTDTYNYVYLAQNEDGVVALDVSDNYPVIAWKIKGSNGKTYDNIQTAIDEAAAAGGGEVWIAAGTYKHGSSLTMKNNVAIYGGFAGTETNKDQRVAGNNTILDGEGKYRVFYNYYTESNPLTNSAKLDNVTIQNGYTSDDGAGMYNMYASPEITNCTFSGNSAYSSGGMFNCHSSPTLTNCTFSGNSANSGGGGMLNRISSSPVLTNCTFSNNSTTGNYSSGGGMCNSYGSSSVLTNCTFTNNSAISSGGGMYNEEKSHLKLTNCILWGNTANNGNEIYDIDLTTTIDTCIIQGGYSGDGTNVITDDPLLQSLADNGGNVETCAVIEGSSAIGAGKIVEGVTTDARGVARSTTAPTIGAYEYVEVFYVVSGGAGSKNGKSWADAYSDVQTAIDSAADAGGGEVWIAAGTYKHGSEMTMKNNVAIYGGFAGTETSKDQRVEGNETILDGEGTYRVFNNNYTETNPLTNSAKLDNVTIQNGYTSDDGAGMYNKYASPEITNCTFTNNSTSYGGGMHNTSSSPTLTNCTFSGNSASSYGGGMHNTSSSPTLTNCTFSGNSASSYGGGMYNRESSPVLTNCTFSGNSASSNGGGMYNDSSSPVLTNCTFSGNSASDDGGGMFNEYYSSPTLTNCTFTNNSATGDYSSGGGMYNYSSSSPVLTNCTFSGNSASLGGGMENGSSSNPTLTNCTFSGNSASGSSYGYGGGMCNMESDPKLTNCTFSGNRASSFGGGMHNMESDPKLTNCILWGNTASKSGNEIYNRDSTTTIDTCIIQGGYSDGGTNIITADPKLQSLNNNGGYVQTCAVIEGSSAIGAGKVVEGVTTDARGIARSSTPTIGAYEYTK